jgi:hypothetical protein
MQFERIIQETGKDFGVWLGDEHEHNLTLTLTKPGSKEIFLSVDMRARRLGDLGEKATMLLVGGLWVEFIDNHVRDFVSKIPQAVKREWREWIEKNPCNGKVQLVQRFEEKY